ncbi:hypothetical protein ACQVNJ_21805 [Bacillus paranthracis]|uniref:hypothetical protein n=1 Tax=Bacillus cereus group sp. Bcc13 TaxID=3018098 RepID=UPI0022E98159|nr:hypothetical protein [Bacillus cereus group sp. Bcc13]
MDNFEWAACCIVALHFTASQVFARCFAAVHFDDKFRLRFLFNAFLSSQVIFFAALAICIDCT